MYPWLVVSGQLLVGAKHLEDKLLVIAKNSSPNASPVQLLVVNYLSHFREQRLKLVWY
jgi:hypothetical protein